MAATRLLLVIICFAFTGSFSMHRSYLLKQQHTDNGGHETNYRLKLVNMAACEIGVREKTNQNDGERVEAYLALVGLHKGDPYCAAFVSFIFAHAGFIQPRSGWSPDLFPASRITKSPLPGNVIGVYFPALKRIAHVGLVERIDHNWCVTIEANTNIKGSREGEGVYRKRRLLKTIYRMADWVTNGRRLP